MRCSRAPQTPDEKDLMEDMKSKWGFKWSGYAEAGRWKTDKLAIIAFEDDIFLRRIVACDPNISFFALDGTDIHRKDFIEAVKNFNPDAVNSDIDALPKSTLPPTPPTAKRPRAS